MCIRLIASHWHNFRHVIVCCSQKFYYKSAGFVDCFLLDTQTELIFYSHRVLSLMARLVVTSPVVCFNYK